MKCLKYCLVAVAVTSIALTGSLASANLLTNAGFEGPPIAAGPAPFVGRWEPFSGDGFASGNIDSFTSTVMPLSGEQHLELLINNVGSTFAGAFQDVDGLSAFVGQIGTFSGWNKLFSGDAGGTEIRIEWRDSVNDTEISRTPNFTPSFGSSYEEFSLSDTMPAGADTARLVYAIQSFGAGPNQQVFVDDTSFVIPEPASIALLGLAGLALASMRRRK